MQGPFVQQRVRWRSFHRATTTSQLVAPPKAAGTRPPQGKRRRGNRCHHLGASFGLGPRRHGPRRRHRHGRRRSARATPTVVAAMGQPQFRRLSTIRCSRRRFGKSAKNRRSLRSNPRSSGNLGSSCSRSGRLSVPLWVVASKLRPLRSSASSARAPGRVPRRRRPLASGCPSRSRMVRQEAQAQAGHRRVVARRRRGMPPSHSIHLTSARPSCSAPSDERMRVERMATVPAT
mmetsp:Transcript_103067/g.291111  ORF Transcript_103067/g.291111 Transcript_103067/m.291111 type:complete len:233 (+) Transcript_103067:1460-2158(+)